MWVGNNIKSLLHFNGADASTVFTDESGKAWTPSGTAALDTAQYKFGTASGLFPSTGDGYISTAAHTDFNFAGGAFTIDFWFRTDNVTQGVSCNFLYQTDDANNNISCYLNPNFATIVFHVEKSGTENEFSISGASLANDTWYHMAIIRGWGGSTTAQTGWQICINGTSQTKTVVSNNPTVQWPTLTSDMIIRKKISGNQKLWIDEFRICNTAMWTSNFTVPSYEYSSDWMSGWSAIR